MRTAALLVGIGLFVGCTSTGEEADPGRLLVTGEAGEVWLVGPDSAERQVLAEETLHPGPVQPTSSRDGDSVVWTTATEEGEPVVSVHTAEGRRDVDVPVFPFFYAFDADDEILAALGNDPDGEGVALMLVDLAMDQAGIVDSDQPYYLDWHPEESLLAVHVGFRELALLEQGERKALPVQTGDFQAPAWTDDGRIVALHEFEGATASMGVQAESAQLVVVDTSDGSHQTLAATEGPVAFDVAGERVAYMGGGSSLRVVGLDGEGDAEISSETVATFEWSPTGDLLLFHVVEEDVGLVPHVWDGDETVEYQAFQPTAVFVTQYLPFWSQYARTVTQWAPDGSGFAYADGNEEPIIWVQPLDGERREAGPGVMVTWAR